MRNAHILTGTARREASCACVVLVTKLMMTYAAFTWPVLYAGSMHKAKNSGPAKTGPAGLVPLVTLMELKMWLKSPNCFYSVLRAVQDL